MSHVLQPSRYLSIFHVEIYKNRTAVVDVGEKELLGLVVLQKDLLDLIESLVRQCDKADNK